MTENPVNYVIGDNNLQIHNDDIIFDVELQDKESIQVVIDNNELNVELNATVNYNIMQFQWVEPPATRNSPGVAGQMSFNDDYIFVCVAPNLWARAILTKGF